MSKKAIAMVLTQFNAPLEAQEFPLMPPASGEVLVRIDSAGICGSDLHMWKGNDPRTPLPIILGHEGVGTIESIDHGRTDILGRPLHAGDRIIWDRGVPCYACYQCVVKKEPSLCPNRSVYGINMSSKEPPHLRGSYASHIYLLPQTKLLKLDAALPPEIFSASACSGATAAHAVELSAIQPGDTVAVLGVGSLGLFALRMALDRGAAWVVAVGTSRSPHKLQMAREFGATHTLEVDKTTRAERVRYFENLTDGRGVDVVIEASGAPSSVEDSVHYLGRGGRVVLPGVATPVGEVSFSVYEQIVLKNATVQGVWVSDTRHLYQAVKHVENHVELYKKMVTATFPLLEVNKAFEELLKKKAIKLVLKP